MNEREESEKRKEKGEMRDFLNAVIYSEIQWKRYRSGQLSVGENRIRKLDSRMPATLSVRR